MDRHEKPPPGRFLNEREYDNFYDWNSKYFRCYIFICNHCGISAGDVYPSWHLVQSLFVETSSPKLAVVIRTFTSKTWRLLRITSKTEKVPRGIRGEKSSKDMASSRNLVSTIGALASLYRTFWRTEFCFTYIHTFTINPSKRQIHELHQVSLSE